MVNYFLIIFFKIENFWYAKFLKIKQDEIQKTNSNLLIGCPFFDVPSQVLILNFFPTLAFLFLTASFHFWISCLFLDSKLCNGIIFSIPSTIAPSFLWQVGVSLMYFPSLSWTSWTLTLAISSWLQFASAVLGRKRWISYRLCTTRHKKGVESSLFVLNAVSCSLDW